MYNIAALYRCVLKRLSIYTNSKLILVVRYTSFDVVELNGVVIAS